MAKNSLNTYMYLKKIISLIGILIFILTLISCKGPLEKKYNPKTFSDDIKELNEDDRIIIKNIINAYERNENVNSIAGNETVLIPSLTFKELKENYIVFHQIWKNSHIASIKQALRSEWSQNFSPSILKKFLNENLEILLSSKRVRNPSNQFIARELIITNNYNTQISFTNNIKTSKKLTDHSYIHIFGIPLLDTGESHIQIIDDLEFRNGHKPSEDTFLKITNVYTRATDNLDETVLTIGEEDYTLNDLNFIYDFGSDSLKNNFETKLSKVDSLVHEQFKLTVWPYNNSRVAQLKDDILSNETFTIDR
ncbi:MAG: hypothetical protein RI575_09425 [Balneolaceae bacterium]|nr:hypothetical protein [Balneolaceae bacterium]MDR9409234.1 hypothetical protein [Balneolaceae bacterium]